MMIRNSQDIETIYRSRDYKACNIEKDEQLNEYSFNISFKNECITDVCVRKYENRIAYHEMIAIKASYRNQGHMKKIHKLECKGYKEKDINKIKLKATRDGICVWLKLGFIIDDNNENTCNIENEIMGLFYDYITTIVFPNDVNRAEKIIDSCKSLKSIISKSNTPYILPNNKMSFTAFLYKKSNTLRFGIQMIKRL